MPAIDTLIARLYHYAEAQPAHDAVVTPRFTLSYAQLAQLVRTQASAFIDAGISGSSVVGIKCADDTRHLVLSLSATCIGATSCTIPCYEADHTQAAVISHCGATNVVDEAMAIAASAQDHNTGSMPKGTPATEARLLFATSGTTGEPKLVIHDASDLVKQAHRHVESGQERFACLASMEHNFAKRHRLYCVAAGATNVFLDPGQESLVAQCQSLGVNVMHVSAFQAQELLATPGIGMLSNIRLKLGGSHVPLPLRQQLRDNITHHLQAGYGTTETGAIGFTDPDDSNAGESVGQPLPGIEVRAVTLDRKPLANGEHGELAVRCEGMFRGYLGNSDLTTSRLDEDGWFYTGDIGYLDKQRRIHLCGRSDDMFVFNSMNIYPQDIEARICQYPDVIDAAVLPKASAVHGNIPVALVVFARTAKPDVPALKKFVQRRVGVRSPRQFIIVAEIPRNRSGKIARREALGLSTRSDHIRHTIVRALGSIATDQLHPSLTSAFENGDKDIALREIELDSLARMELLIALETEYDAVITPLAFRQFRSLGNIVSHILSAAPQDELKQDPNPAPSGNYTSATGTDIQPHVVRLFRRTFSYCHTVAQLSTALTTLEHRLTPIEVECLHDRHASRLLIPASAQPKFDVAISRWLQDLKRMLLDSGKTQLEPFTSHRIAPTASLYRGPESHDDKTLVVCFSMKGGRCLMMPNSVLMQHTDSTRFDLLIISEPLNQAYLHGVPLLGSNIFEVIDWIAKLELTANYRHIRTLGCSAGGFAAVVAGYLLGAEMAVCVGGRFHAERYPGKILDRIITTRRAIRRGRCQRVLMSYANDRSRDRIYARIIAWLSGGSRVGVEFTNGKVGHIILERLKERGELGPYLAQTIYAEMGEELIATARANVIMSFPTATIRPYGTPPP